MLRAISTDASDPMPKLQRVEWLADLLDLSVPQTYDAIAKQHVPLDCVVRVGRRIRVIEDRVADWLTAHNKNQEFEKRKECEMHKKKKNPGDDGVRVSAIKPPSRRTSDVPSVSRSSMSCRDIGGSNV